MLCDEIMQPPVTILEGDAVEHAARVMRDENIGFLPVVDHEGRHVGTLTDRDIAIRLVADRRPPATSVREIMTPDVVVCRPHDELTLAEQMMGRKSISRIIVADDDGRVVGVISITDIAERDDGWRVARTLKRIGRRDVRQR